MLASVRTEPALHLHCAALLLGFGLRRAVGRRAVLGRHAWLVLEPDHDIAVRKVEVGMRLRAHTRRHG